MAFPFFGIFLSLWEEFCPPSALRITLLSPLLHCDHSGYHRGVNLENNWVFFLTMKTVVFRKVQYDNNQIIVFMHCCFLYYFSRPKFHPIFKPSTYCKSSCRFHTWTVDCVEELGGWLIQ